MRILLFAFCWLFLLSSIQGQITSMHFDSIWSQDIPLSQKIGQVDSLAMSIDPYKNKLPLRQVYLAFNEANKTGNTLWQNRLQLSIGSIYSTIDIQDSAKIYLHNALVGLQQNKDRLYIPRAYRELSWLYTFIPEYDEALKYAYLSLEGYEALGDKEQVAVIKSRIAQIWGDTGQSEKALPFLLEAEKTLTQYDNPKNLGYTYRSLAQYYRSVNDTLNARKNFDLYIETMKKMPQQTASFLVGAYYRRGNYYQELKKYDLAEKDMRLSLDIAVEDQDTLLELLATYQLGSLYAEMEQYEKAIQLLEEVIRKVNSNSKEDEYFFLGVDFEEMYGKLAQAYAHSGQYEQAYSFLSKHTKIADSLFTIDTNRAMLDMQTKYETEKKETLLKQKQQELYVALGGIGVALIIAMLFWWGYSNKKRSNVLLEKRNEEKEFLIKEIHHRVKNNLQVLSSLLGLQSDYIQDANALKAVNESRNRVQSMGLIHQKLYMSDNLAAVEMKEYVREMIEYLLSSFGLEGRVDITSNINVPPLDVDTAIPLGLIINELVTNSLKYAFPKSRTGVIDISLWVTPDKVLYLQVADDGIGEVAPSDQQNSTKFGSELVKILSKKLKGEVQTNSDKGYNTLIGFHRYKLSL